MRKLKLLTLNVFLFAGGFLGERALGLNYLPTPRWRLMLGYGQTLSLGDYIHQFNNSELDIPLLLLGGIQLDLSFLAIVIGNAANNR